MKIRDCLLRGVSLFVTAIVLGGCSVDTAPTNGVQRCAESSKKSCTAGFYCATDGFCWREGSGPASNLPDTGTGSEGLGDGGMSMQPTDTMPPPDVFVPHEFLEAPAGRALVPGGTVMKSTRFRAVMTTSQSPTGNNVMKSSRYRYNGGLIGSTQ